MSASREGVTTMPLVPGRLGYLFAIAWVLLGALVYALGFLTRVAELA